jgi:hypothetical protein
LPHTWRPSEGWLGGHTFGAGKIVCTKFLDEVSDAFIVGVFIMFELNGFGAMSPPGLVSSGRSSSKTWKSTMA